MAIAKWTVEGLRSAYQNRLTNRLELFFLSVNTAYERATREDIAKLNDYIESDIGQDMLANYAEVITKTSSKRAHMVMALLYCADTDLKLDEIDQIIFVKALESIDDRLIDFFLACTEMLGAPLQEDSYDRVSINEGNINQFQIKEFGHAGISVAAGPDARGIW